MEELLLQIGFNAKEISCYLALLEFGQQPASVIAKKLDMPRPTALFTLNGLAKQSYVQRTKRGKTQFYYADPEQMIKAKKNQVEEESRALENLEPLLKECKNPLTDTPKVSFFEGVKACKRAFADMLTSETDILEFATHDDVYDKFGKKWAEDYVAERTKRKILAKAICNDTKLNRAMEPLDKKQMRETSFIPNEKGKMYSVISMYNDKLLMLNLSSDPFGILIQNAAIVESMKTIHRLAWR